MVSTGLSVWVEVCGWDEPGDAVPDLDGPVVLVDEVVVVAAEQYAVVGARWAAV